MATHSSVLAWTIPWTEKPGGLQSRGSKCRTGQSARARAYTHTHTHTHTHWPHFNLITSLKALSPPTDIFGDNRG